MNTQSFWQLFLETGAPEMYLLYKQAQSSEEANVFDHQRTGPSGLSL